MIITISGKPGSGKSTVGREVARRLRLHYISIGERIRKIAHDMGKDINALMDDKQDFSAVQRRIEDYIESLVDRDNVVIDGRDAFFHIRNATHIFLTVETSVAAKRIFEAHRATEPYSNVEEAERELDSRSERERALYKHMHRIDIYDPKHYHLVIDTSYLTVEEIISQIVETVR